MELLDFITNIGIVQVILILAGLALVISEMFSPGFGIPGITGLIFLVIGVVATARNALEALIMIVIIIIILGVALTLVLRSAAKGRISRTIVLKDTLDKESGFTGTENLEHLIGKEGITITVLRPAGTADISGTKLDVVSEGNFIPKDTKIKVIKVDGPRIVVRKVE